MKTREKDEKIREESEEYVQILTAGQKYDELEYSRMETAKYATLLVVTNVVHIILEIGLIAIILTLL